MILGIILYLLAGVIYFLWMTRGAEARALITYLSRDVELHEMDLVLILCALTSILWFPLVCMLIIKKLLEYLR